jgi:hypothetical protein
MKPLRSGDINIIIPDQAAKDYFLNQSEIEEVKILRQDYLIEMSYVSLSLLIAGGKNADNS